jgi:hypothetical protein
MSRTHESYHDQLDAGGPEDLYVLKLAMERQKDRLDVERALAWLRVSAWDAEVFLKCVPTFMTGLDAASPTLRADLLDAARHVRAGYFPTGEDSDVPFALAEIMQALDAIPEAEALFHESVALHGASPEKLHRLAVCASAMHRPADAVARVEAALGMDPNFEPARAMRVALQGEMRRRH